MTNKPTSEKKSTKKLTEKNALFIRNHSGICIVTKNYLKKLSFEQAVNIGLSTLTEIRQTLMGDALTNGETYIENVKVISGLNNTLHQLERNFPSILKHIHKVEPEFSDVKTFKC